MEKLREALQISLANLMANTTRSLLSILGIVIGISSVITVLALDAGVRERIVSRVNAMGANVYTIFGTYDPKIQRVGTIELQDVTRLQALPFVESVFPNIDMYREVRSRYGSSHGNVQGVDNGYLKAADLNLIEGRNFSPAENEERDHICLVSAEGSKELFPNGNALGESIYVDQNPWQIIGIFESKNRGKSGNEVLCPFLSLLRASKDITIQNLAVHIRPEFKGDVLGGLREALERGNSQMSGLFMIRDPKEIIAKTLEVRKTLTIMGIVIASISLLVGGIGMMNVMMTSVAERLREIGIRRAVGARRKDILFQFITESCLLSVSGGVFGLFLGAAMAHLIPLLFKQFAVAPAIVRPGFLIIAGGSGIFLGMVFGFYPAVKASRLSPAEALRTE